MAEYVKPDDKPRKIVPSLTISINMLRIWTFLMIGLGMLLYKILF